MNLDDLKLILVPTDFSESSATALPVAVRLAQTFHAAIEIFHVDIDATLVLPPPGDLIALPLMFQSVVDGASRRLERVVADVRKAGIACTAASESGRTHSAIVEQARRIGAGLIVMGSHARHGLSHALLGSVAEKVVQNAPCAVLVVPVIPGGQDHV
jgi:nucleotide-binding universal stress UspA family protein